MHIPARPAIDALESRRLLAVTFVDGVIRVVATDKKDVIIAQNVDAKHFRLNVNGATSVYSNGAVSLIDIRTKDSADRIDLTGIKARSLLDGGKGGDTLLGGRRADTLVGGGGSDRLFGNEDADSVDGGLLADTLDGGLGDDRLFPFSDPTYDDSVFGGEGYDTVDYGRETKDLTIEIRNDGDAPMNVVTDEIAGDVEVILGGSGDDVIVNRLANGLIMDGGAGDDSITGSGGNDYLIGGPGRDTLRGGAGSDLFRLASRDGLADVVDGGDGFDKFQRTTSDAADLVTNVEG